MKRITIIPSLILGLFISLNALANSENSRAESALVDNYQQTEGLDNNAVYENGRQKSLRTPVKSVNSPRLDVNTATLEELITIKGIGPSKAAAILKYRKEIGGFKSIDELIGVRGIGEKALMKLRVLLAVPKKEK